MGRSLSSAPAAGSPILLDRQVFTSSGSWTKPANGSGNIAAGIGKTVLVEVISGGGSGAANASTMQSVLYGGCGGGETLDQLPIDLCGSTESVTVGAGGAAVVMTAGSGSSNGNQGGDSSFGTKARALGGLGGTVGAPPPSSVNGDRAGGTSLTPNVNWSPGAGAGGVYPVNVPTQGTGSRAAPAAAGADNAAAATNGNNAAAYRPGGGGGAVRGTGSINVQAGNGGLYGAGGGAAFAFSSGNSATSGAGAQGVVVVSVYG